MAGNSRSSVVHPLVRRVDGVGDRRVGSLVGGDMDSDSHTVILPSIIESLTIKGLGYGQL